MTLKHDEVRAALIKTTLALMDEGGLEAVKARTISQKVGVSVGTIYNLFESVDGLIRHANVEIYRQLRESGAAEMAAFERAEAERAELGTMLDEETRLLRRLLALATLYVGFVAANANRWQALLAFNQRQTGDDPAWYGRELESLSRVLESVVIASPLGTDQDKVKLGARALWSSVHGIISLNYVGRVSQEARDVTLSQIDLIVRAFVRGLYAPAH